MPVDVNVFNKGEKMGTLKISIPGKSNNMGADNLESSLVNIGRFISFVAHGIRNPLNAIKGAVFYLSQKYEGDKTVSEFMQIADEEISRIDAFVTEMLAFTRQSSKRVNTDINELIKRLLILISYQMDLSHIEHSCKFNDIPSARINPFELGQAILNILNNSIEAMPDGGKIQVKTFCDVYFGKDYIVLDISDTGPGILTKNMKRCTDQVENGRGFGLNITREIIERHGGHLLIEAKEGLGTTVQLLIPKQTLGGIDELPGEKRSNFNCR